MEENPSLGVKEESMKIDCNIVDVIVGNVAFYTDRYDRYALYAEYQKTKKCLEFYPVESKEFESCLRVWYRAKSGGRDAPNVMRILK